MGGFFGGEFAELRARNPVPRPHGMAKFPAVVAAMGRCRRSRAGASHGREVMEGIGFGGGMTTAPVAKTAISAVAASVGRCRNAGNGAVEPDRVDRHDRLRAVRRRALPRGA